MRGQTDSKSNTCMGGVFVDVTGIGVKGNAQYLGRSTVWPRATIVERRWERTAEVSRRQSRLFDRAEGLNMKRQQET